MRRSRPDTGLFDGWGRPVDRTVWRIETWTEGGSLEHEIALIQNFDVARAAFDRACALWPDKHVMLRQRARVIADSRRQN